MSNIFSIVRGSIPFWLLIIALMLFSSQLDAQQRSFGTLPLVDAGEVKVNQQGNLNDTPEYKHLLKIYTNLIEARGDLRYRIPTLFFKDVEGHVAYIDYNTFDIITTNFVVEIGEPLGEETLLLLASKKPLELADIIQNKGYQKRAIEQLSIFEQQFSHSYGTAQKRGITSKRKQKEKLSSKTLFFNIVPN